MAYAELQINAAEITLMDYSLSMKRNQADLDGRPTGSLTGCNVTVKCLAQHALGTFTGSMLPSTASAEIVKAGTIEVHFPNRGGDVIKKIEFEGGRLVYLEEGFEVVGGQGEPVITATFAVEKLKIDDQELLNITFI